MAEIGSFSPKRFLVRPTQGLAIRADFVSRDLSDLQQQLLVFVCISIQVGRSMLSKEGFIPFLDASKSTDFRCLVRIMSRCNGVLKTANPLLHLLCVFCLQYMNPMDNEKNDMSDVTLEASEPMCGGRWTGCALPHWRDHLKEMRPIAIFDRLNCAHSQVNDHGRIAVWLDALSPGNIGQELALNLKVTPAPRCHHSLGSLLVEISRLCHGMRTNVFCTSSEWSQWVIDFISNL